MQSGTFDFLPHSSPTSAAEGGRFKLSIRERITQALLRASEKDCNEPRNRFIPRNALFEMISMEGAEQILRASLGRHVEDTIRLQEMARDISPSPGACVCCFRYCTGRRMILATLLLFGREDIIPSYLSLQSPQFCDKDLPLSLESLNNIDNNLSARERELFIHMQWQVYTPFLAESELDKSRDIVRLHEQISLPWMEKERIGERMQGEVSYIEQIKIYPGNHDLVSFIVGEAMSRALT